MTKTIADPNCQINAAAKAVLAYLAERDMPTEGNKPIFINTATWYNGRERGYCIYASDFSSSLKLVVTFAENRNSDHIFVDHWLITSACVNPPTLVDYTQDAYNRRTMFSYSEAYHAADFIVEVVKNFIQACNDAPPIVIDKTAPASERFKQRREQDSLRKQVIGSLMNPEMRAAIFS